jgi:hypothetical protein
LSPNVREALATIRRNVGVEVRLIDDLLDLARIRSGKLTLQTETVDAHDMLRDAIAICIANLDRRTARIVQAFSAANVRLQADPARLRQIFWNLLSNAVKFTPPEGTIHVRTRDLKDELQIEVTDTGALALSLPSCTVFLTHLNKSYPNLPLDSAWGLPSARRWSSFMEDRSRLGALGLAREHHSLSDFRFEVAAKCGLLLLLPAPKVETIRVLVVTRIPPKAYVFCSLAKGMRFALPVAWRRPSGLPQRSSLMF